MDVRGEEIIYAIQDAVKGKHRGNQLYGKVTKIIKK